MNEFAYFKDNSALIAVCLTVGLVFGVILPLILNRIGLVCTWVWDGLKLAFANEYFVWCVMATQIGLEVLLLMQWIFGYNAMYESNNPYNAYAYFPLTVTIPAFFINIGFFIACCFRLGEVGKK